MVFRTLEHFHMKDKELAYFAEQLAKEYHHVHISWYLYLVYFLFTSFGYGCIISLFATWHISGEFNMELYFIPIYLSAGCFIIGTLSYVLCKMYERMDVAMALYNVSKKLNAQQIEKHRDESDKNK